MTKIVTPECFLSYPHLVKPQEGKNGKPGKFGVALVFKKDADLTALHAAIKEVGIEKFGPSFEAKVAAGALDVSLRPNARKDDYEQHCPGGLYLNARSSTRPGLVFPWAGADGKPERVPEEKITEVFYAGALVRASISVYAYVTDEKKGVSFGINNLQKLRDSEPWSGRSRAEDDFTAVGSASDYAGDI